MAHEAVKPRTTNQVYVACKLDGGSCPCFRKHDELCFSRWSTFRPLADERLSATHHDLVYARVIAPREKEFNAGRMDYFEDLITARHVTPFPALSTLTLDLLRQRFRVDPIKEKEIIGAIAVTAAALKNKQIDLIAAPFTDYGTAFLVKIILRALGQNPPVFYASVSENYRENYEPGEKARFNRYPSVQTPSEDILILGNKYNKGGYFLIADLWGPAGRVTQMMFCIATRAGFTQERIAVVKSRWGPMEVHDPDDVYNGAFSIFFPQGIHDYYKNDHWFPHTFELDHFGFFKGYPSMMPVRSGEGHHFSSHTYLTPVFRSRSHDETIAALMRYMELLVKDVVTPCLLS